MALKTRKNTLYALLSGLMLTAAFPPLKLDWMAWIALVPLLKSIENGSRSRAFKLGFISGFTHYMTLIYWIIVSLKLYGGLNFVISFIILIIFCLYLSLYPALFSYLICFMRGSRFAGFLSAGIWVGLEYLRAKLLSGFPWCLLGYTQYRHLDLIQIADLFGVYGLSFLVVFSNVLLYVILFGRPFCRKGFLKWELTILVTMVFLTLAYGHYRLSEGAASEREQRSLKIAIIQGNIDQSVKWIPAYQKKTITVYQRLTRAARSFKPDLVVWPETAIPFFFQDNAALATEVIGISEELGADLIFGSPAFKRKNGAYRYYNRAYSLSPDGRIHGYYDKVHLVPFGEYVPLQRFLPFVQRLVPAAGDFASGESVKPLKLPDVSAGVLICFEVIFPELARLQVKNGAEILINMTNDAWFGMTGAPYQHLSMAVFRAVENRRPLVRAANTGISAFIGPTGKVLKITELFTEGVLTGATPITGSSPGFYTRYGDLLVFALMVIISIKFLYHLCYYKKFSEADRKYRGQ